MTLIFSQSVVLVCLDHYVAENSTNPPAAAAVEPCVISRIRLLKTGNAAPRSLIVILESFK